MINSPGVYMPEYSGEESYLRVLDHLWLEAGEEPCPDRTGVGRHRQFGLNIDCPNVEQQFPLLTTKQVNFTSIVEELLFFLRGDTNTGTLNTGIWKEWQDSNGNLGPLYPHQWRNYGGQHKNRPQPLPRLPEGYSANFRKVGYCGSSFNGLTEDPKALYRTWMGMICRCYCPSNSNYAFYGGRGVAVCSRWLVFELFCEDAKNLPGWENKVTNWSGYELDKDLIGDGFNYSPEHCAWVTKEENMRGKQTKTYRITHDSGEEVELLHPVEFYRSRNLHQGNFSSMLRGERKKAQGWTLKEVYDRSEGVDQIAELVKNLKEDPFSSRHVVSAWNPVDIPHMALAPCHCLFQFFVEPNAQGELVLDCLLYQRSADIFLGVPFNIASYSLLLMMVAKRVGMVPGSFMWRGGDVHIYDNHLEQALEQLHREPRKAPTVSLNYSDDTELWDVKTEDITLHNYDPHPAIKATVAV